MPLLTIAGYLGAAEFHEARLLGEDIVGCDPLLKLKVLGLVESEWLEHLRKKRQVHIHIPPLFEPLVPG